MSQPPILASILKSRGAIVELFIAAVILAIGVNLFAAAIATFFDSNANALVWLSSALIFLSIGLIGRRTISTTRVSRTFEGFIYYSGSENKLIEIPRYEISEQLSLYIDGLFAENEAPKKLWDSDPISKTFDRDAKAGVFKKRATAAGQLLIEATEYFVLQKLSLHLSDYFNRVEVDGHRLEKLTREDVPSVLFKNRFLDTFSRPMQERAAFVDNMLKKKVSFGEVGSEFGEVVFSYSADGPHYAKFDLVLPSGAKVSRTQSGCIEIDTPRFCLKIEVEFAGFGAVLPRDFERLYLDRPNSDDTNAFALNVVTDIKFKALSLLFRSGWQYHNWLDSFLDSLEKDFSMNEFFCQIDWNAAATIAHVVQRAVAEANVRPNRK